MASTKNGVIYPDDYNKAADILADMKVLADSVDGNIEQINEKIKQNSNNIEFLQADNTTNKKSIEELKQENIEIKAENERLRDDIKSIALTGEESGESIDLNDSSNARFNKFEIYGNHKQETRTGKNHFFTSTSSSTTNGITYSPQADKSSIIVDATATDNATKWLIVDAAQFKLEAGSYVLSSCGTCDNSIYIGLGGKTSSGAEKFNITEKGTAVSFNINEDVYLNCYIQTVSGTQIENKLIKIMIVKAGVDYQNYESYGAMPSPDFPSEIKTVKDSVEVKVVNKNFVKIDETIDFSISNVQFTCKDGKLNLNGTSNANISSVNNNFKNYFKFVLPAGSYTYSQKNSVNSNIFTYILDLEDTSKRYATANGNSVKNASFTLEKTTEVFVGMYSGSNVAFNNVEIELQIEKGLTATDFVEHQEQVITMPVQQEMLKGDYFDFENEKEVHNWEKLILTGNEDYTNPQTNLYNLGNLNKKSTPNLNLIVLQCNKYKAVKSVSTNNEFLNENADVDYACGFHTNQTEIRIKDARFSSLTEFKNNIKQQYDAGTPVIIYYKLLTPTECDFTNEQKAVAKQIKETLHTYKNITHIYSTDETSPIVNVEYAKDLNTIISNIQALVLNNASEEVSE